MIHAGGKIFIRTGTSGQFSDAVKIGDVVLVTGAARDDGTTREYVPLEYPAVADLEITSALRSASKRLDVDLKIGLCRSGDAMCNESHAYEKWKNKSILCSDAETSTIFVISTLRRVQAGALLLVDGPPFEGAPLETIQNEYTDRAVDSMINVALTAVEIIENS